MNGLEALERLYGVVKMSRGEQGLVEFMNPCLEAIGKDLKVLQILKEKKVKLPKIAEWLADNLLKDIKRTTEFYNRYIVNGYMEELTEEEMTLIVDWLKGEE